MKTVAVCQARVGSTRLPGKVMMDLGADPLLYWVWKAATNAPGVDLAVIATSTLPADDVIADFCAEERIPCFRGSESDVLSRFVGAAEQYRAEVVLRLTCDCPMLDPDIIGAVVALREQTGAAYASNIYPPSFPDGLDTECFTVEVLMAAHAEATRPIDRDNVSHWIYRNRSRFPAVNMTCPIPGLAKERWVCDTQDDFDFLKLVIVPMRRRPASYLEILRILNNNPEWRSINTHHPRNERFHESTTQEAIIPRIYTRSKEALGRAEKSLPLGAQTFSKSKVSWGEEGPLFLSHGQGGLVWDTDGNEYVDLVSSLLPTVLGTCDPDVDSAIRHQLDSGISFSLATELEAQLSERLCRLIPCAEGVRFGKNGNDVTTAAIRLARTVTRRSHVISIGYHGWQDWSVAPNPGVPDEVAKLTHKAPYGYLEKVQDILLHFPHAVAAIIVDPGQSLPKGRDLTHQQYLAELKAMAHRHGAIFIMDEIITGFRWAIGGAQELYGVTPDLACFSKALGNGMPIAALVGKMELMKRFAPGDEPNCFFSTTFGGEALSLAAAIAVVDKIEREGVIDKLWATGGELASQVEELIEDHGLEDMLELHGSPPRVMVTFKDPDIKDLNPLAWQQKKLFMHEMANAGVLMIQSHNICYAHDQNCVMRVLKAYDHVLPMLKS